MLPVLAAGSDMDKPVGTLYVIAAPSGAGKTSLVRALMATDPLLALSVSYTTRPPRPGEIDGEHYHFITPERFQALIDGDRLLEHALVHGHHYGTARDSVEHAFAHGRDVILEIDWQGARQIRRRFPDMVGIFVLPPSREALLERLNKRAQDSPEVIARRLANAREEMAHATEFDYLVVNDHFEDALADIQAIVRAQRRSIRVQNKRCADLLRQLLTA
jgi:guanylate kinase